MIIDRLYEAVEERGPVCVGLDPTPSLLPEGFATTYASLSDAYFAFNKKIVDATLDLAACYKVQIAHYEALGVAGLACYRDTLRYIREKGAIVIGDVKRGDIASTQACYAQAHFQGDFEADFLTLNPFLGSDSIAPFFPYLDSGEKGVFILIRSSNPGAAEFQDLMCGDRPVYLWIAEQVHSWGARFQGEKGFSLIGGVVGAKGDILAAVRKAFPKLFLLVPGYGAQGAGGQEVAPAFLRGNGAVVASARSIIGAHQGKPDGAERFAEYARDAVLSMQNDIRQWLK